jgi:hypothetical protein
MTCAWFASRLADHVTMPDDRELCARYDWVPPPGELRHVPLLFRWRPRYRQHQAPPRTCLEATAEASMDVAGGNGSRERCLHILALSPPAEERDEASFLKTTRKLTTSSAFFTTVLEPDFRASAGAAPFSGRAQ